SDAVDRVELDVRFAAGLEDLGLYSHLWLLYWMDRARRDLIRQVPAHLGRPRGTFALRSPVRPNPIALAAVELPGIEGPTPPGRAGAGHKGQPRLPDRWLGLHFPRLPRPPPADAAVGWAAGGGGARLLRHAVEAAAGLQEVERADAHCRHLRRRREDVPQRD